MVRLKTFVEIYRGSFYSSNDENNGLPSAVTDQTTGCYQA